MPAEFCPECNPNPPPFWRDAPMNPVVKARLTSQRYAYTYYLTLEDAFAACNGSTEIKGGGLIDYNKGVAK